MFDPRQAPVRSHERGFTLIELLVVSAVIACLFLLVTAMITRVRQSAVRTVCASNLHQWGMSLMAYAGDNKGLIPSTAVIWGNLIYPPALWESGAHVTDRQEFSIPGLIDYMPTLGDAIVVIDGQRYLRTAGPWACPASRASKNFSPVIDEWSGNSYLQIQYGFYGQVEKWSGSTTRPEELSGRRLDAQRVLMNDLTYRFTGVLHDNFWYVSHMDGIFPCPSMPPIQGRTRCWAMAMSNGVVVNAFRRPCCRRVHLMGLTSLLRMMIASISKRSVT